MLLFHYFENPSEALDIGVLYSIPPVYAKKVGMLTQDLAEIRAELDSEG